MMKRPPAHNSVHSSQSMKLHSKSSLNMIHLVSPNDSRLLVNSMNHNDPVKQCRRRFPLEAIPTISSHHNIIISNSEDPIRSNVTKQPPPPASNNKTYAFTKMWGNRTEQAMQELLAAIPDKGVSFKIVMD